MADPKKTIKLLTIDDDASVRNSIHDFLEDLEYDVIEAEDGRRGLEYFEQQHPDLVMVDIRMPVMNGLQVLEAITRSSPHTPVIVISGTAGIGDVVEALRLGAWDYLIKPIMDLGVLKHAVEKALERADLLLIKQRDQELLEEEVTHRTAELKLHQEHLEEMVQSRTEDLSREVAERKLAESRFRDIANSSSDWFWEVDEQLRFSYISPRFYELSHLTPDDIIGKSGRELTSSRKDTALDELQLLNEQTMLRHEAFRDHEYELISEEGMSLIVRISGIPTFDSDNNFTGYRGSGTDVTELRSAQEMLLESEKLAALGSLVAGVAHEINTPIGICLTSSTLQKAGTEKIFESLNNDTLSKDDLTSYIELSLKTAELFENNIRRASDLIQNFKQIAVSQSHYKIEQFFLKGHVNNIITSIEPSLKDKQIQFNIDIKDTLSIKSYLGFYYEILINLINNSYIYGFEGKDDCQISITAKPLNKGISIVYQDNGIGLSKEVQQHIFEPFFTTGRIKGGTGLGMSIIYNIVTGQLHGQLKIQSKPDKPGFHLLIKIPDILSSPA